MTNNPKEMAEIVATYHKQIQHNDHDPTLGPEWVTLENTLDPVRVKLSEMSKRKLCEDIDEERVREAMKNTNLEKTPGLDGILVKLWKTMDSQFRAKRGVNDASPRCNIVWALTQVYQDIEEHGMDVEAGFNEGCMTPIYKKKGPDDIVNYRLITLLSTNYKIYTKAISISLVEVVPEVVNRDQAGFIQGRSIFDQVKTTKLVIDYMEQTNRGGAVVALDQEKAYDKILHPYLWVVLEKFEFPPRFIRTMKTLYQGAKTRILINRELSRTIPIIRGVQQGDPLSCLLFNLAIEPLAELIQKSNTLSGIPIPNHREYLKVKLFADDTMVFLSERDKVRNLQSILRGWCAALGAVRTQRF